MTAPTRPLRIVAADADQDQRRFYQNFLPTLGHEVVAAFESGKALVEWCVAVRFDLLITEVNLPDLDGIAAAIEVYQRDPVPTLLVSAQHDREVIERALRDHVYAYLSKPCKPVDLAAAVLLVRRRFEQFLDAVGEATGLRKSLEERKLVERAKGVLMRRAQVDEEEAHRRLQRLASDRNLKVIDVAQILLMAEEAFAGPGRPSSGGGGR